MDAPIRAILLGDDLTFAHTSRDVQLLLEATSYDLVVICERFDSQGFDLVRLLGAVSPPVPVVFIRLRNAINPPPRPDRYRETVMGLGARGLADLRASSAVEPHVLRLHRSDNTYA